MAEPYVSEIRMFSFNWAPIGWSQCNGQSMPIQQNAALYSLIGTRFGGDGQNNFLLPDLRGRVPVGQAAMNQNQSGGAENVALTLAQLPQHTHIVNATTANGDVKPYTNAFFAAGYDKPKSASTVVYAGAANLTALNQQTISSVGGGASHNNMQPSLVVNFCIATTGYYPSRN